MRNTLKMRALPAVLASILSVSVFAGEFRIADIRVEGLQRISAGTVFSYLPVKPGARFNTEDSAKVIKALYRSGLFSQVRLLRDGNTLVVQVKELPVIGEINLKGNKDFRSNDLKKALAEAGIAQGQSYSPEILQQLVKELTAQYQARSKYAAKIQPTVRQLSRGRVAIDLDIQEGRSGRIKQIEIVGNKIYSDETLRTLLDTKTTRWNSFLTKSDQYDRNKIQADLERLETFYKDRGFMDFKVDSTQVELSPDRKQIYLTVNLHEGKLFKVKDYRFNGNPVVPLKELEGLLTFKRGDLYNYSALRQSVIAIRTRLADEGYARAEVKVIPDIDRLTGEISYNFVIVPGVITYVRRIAFSGNTKTYDSVLRREMRQEEAAPYSASDIARSQERLRRLPSVETLEQTVKPVPGHDDEIDLEYKLTERSTSSIQGGIGYGESSGVLFNLQYNDDNFFGTGDRLGLSFGKSASSEEYSFDFTNPYFTPDGVSLNYNLNYSKYNYKDGALSDWASDTWGATATFGYPLSEYQKIYFGGGIRGLQINTGKDVAAEITDYLKEHGDRYKEGVLTLSWAKDTQDSAYFSSSGMLNRLNAEITVPGSSATYYKLGYRNRSYFPLTQDNSLIAGLRADISYGNGYGKTDALPFYRHYYAGGFNTLRGFKYGSLGPRYANGDAAGGDFRTTGGVELMLPWKLGDSRSANIRVGAFMDFGNVYSGIKDFKVKDFRYSAGAFVQWLSPIGLLNMSYAVPLNHKKGDETERFQFTVGRGF